MAYIINDLGRTLVDNVYGNHQNCLQEVPKIV